jgi:hypothetical protein
VRRLVPLALVGLLGLGVAAGAAIGAAGSPPPGPPALSSGPTPAEWVAHLLAATAGAGTAHFAYTHVTTSPVPDLRSTLRGSGMVVFGRGDVEVTEVDHQTEFEGNGPGAPTKAVPESNTTEEIGIGSTLYRRLSVPLASAVPSWLKLSVPWSVHGQLGLTTALNAAVALDALVGSDPVVGVRDEGRSTVDGVAVTKYVVTTAPPSTCSSATRATAPKVDQRPSTVWLDTQGRLVQVRSSEYDGGIPAAVLRKVPTFAAFPTGPTVTTATLTFSDFGAPVHIAAPPPSALVPNESSSGSAFAVASCGAGRHP